MSLPGTSATVRGYSAPDLVVEDEAAHCPDELYRGMRPMLAVSGGRLMLLSAPFGRRGHFFEGWERDEDDWQRVEVTADDCPRITSEFLEQERRSRGERWFRQDTPPSIQRRTQDSVIAPRARITGFYGQRATIRHYARASGDAAGLERLNRADESLATLFATWPARCRNQRSVDRLTGA